jgi:hypothetical protein
MPPAPRPALTRAPVRPHPLAPAGVAEPTPAPEATTVMDWFHVTMRLTVLTQLAKGLRAPPPAASADSVAAQLARLKTPHGSKPSSRSWLQSWPKRC